MEEVTDDLRRLARDMFATMYHAEGVGLAAPQIGVSQRLFVVDVPERAEGGGEPVRHVHALVNPVIVSSSTETAKETEGCLSIPGFEEPVTRPAQVVVEAQSLDGGPVRIEANGMLARVLQHETDHLDGVLFIDRLSPLKRSLIRKKWRKSREGSRDG